MGQSYFIFNGRDCREMGVRLVGPIGLVRPEERVEHVQIPGRAGDLTRLEGDDIFNSYIQTAEISVQGALNVRNVLSWLRGAGYLTTSSEPDRRQMARVIGAITLDKVSKYLDAWRGQVQFYCQPFKELLWERPETISAAGSIVNNGDVVCKPLWKLTTSDAAVTLTVSHSDGSTTSMESMTVTNVGPALYIDSDGMEILSSDMRVSMAPWASGDFPVLRPGSGNYVSGSGWSSIEITKRERFL